MKPPMDFPDGRIIATRAICYGTIFVNCPVWPYMAPHWKFPSVLVIGQDDLTRGESVCMSAHTCDGPMCELCFAPRLGAQIPIIGWSPARRLGSPG